MKRIFKRIQINKELLKLNPLVKDFSEYLENETHDTIPSGKVKGAYFISYLPDSLPTTISSGEGGVINPNFSLATMLSHTNITLKDSRGHLLTEPTDIKDYEHKNGGYGLGFKELDFQSSNERITIAWETITGTPILGEFVFIIESDNCGC